MPRRLINLSALLLVVILFAILVPSCSSKEPEATPSPPTSEAYSAFLIDVVKPNNARPLKWASVTVRVTPNSDVQATIVGVSFPDLSYIDHVQFVDTDLPTYEVYAPGQEVYTDYGRGGEITAQYPILEAHHITKWRRSEQKVLSFNVRPERAGTFTLYVKAYGYVQAEGIVVDVSEPTSGTIDQQNEYVQVHRFEVLDLVQ
jgi:hypothetical protein